MVLSRLLKVNLVLLALVGIGVIASALALYGGNKRFLGILGIALFALVLVLWRIYSLTQHPVSESELPDLNIDLESLTRLRPPLR